MHIVGNHWIAERCGIELCLYTTVASLAFLSGRGIMVSSCVMFDFVQIDKAYEQFVENQHFPASNLRFTVRQHSYCGHTMVLRAMLHDTGHLYLGQFSYM